MGLVVCSCIFAGHTACPTLPAPKSTAKIKLQICFNTNQRVKSSGLHIHFLYSTACVLWSRSKICAVLTTLPSSRKCFLWIKNGHTVFPWIIVSPMNHFLKKDNICDLIVSVCLTCAIMDCLKNCLKNPLLSIQPAFSQQRRLEKYTNRFQSSCLHCSANTQ